MEQYQFGRPLTGTTVTCRFPQLETIVTPGSDRKPRRASLFFPGCSFINYGPPLVQAVPQHARRHAGRVDGISRCCAANLVHHRPDDAVPASFGGQPTAGRPGYRAGGARGGGNLPELRHGAARGACRRRAHGALSRSWRSPPRLT